MHIGFITSESPFDPSRGGGIASYLRAIIPALLKLGHRVTLFSNTREQAAACKEKNLKVCSFRLPGFHSLLDRLPFAGSFVTHPVRQIEWSKKFHDEILKMHKTDPLDVIECSEVGGLYLHSICPFVVRLHGTEYVFRKYTGQPIDVGLRINHGFEKKILERAAGITAPSHFHAKEVSGSFGWPEEKITVIPNPAPERLLEDARRMVVEKNKKAPVLLYAGRLAPVKGVKVLLEAFPLIREKFPTAQLRMAGPWQMPKSPEHYGIHQDMGARWLGAIPWEKLMAEEYPQASLFIMPSYYETFNIACLEAMAFVLPIVAAKAGGIPEVVEEGVTGLLVPAGDPQALAGAVNRLLFDADFGQALGQAGRRRVEKFRVEEIAVKTAALYERVIKK